MTFLRGMLSLCYYSANLTVLNSPNYVVPCGNTSAISDVLNCCDVGANNLCLSNSICYDPNTVPETYYLSPCTDETYSATECPQYCSKWLFFDLCKTVLDCPGQAHSYIQRIAITRINWMSSMTARPRNGAVVPQTRTALPTARVLLMRPSMHHRPTILPSSTHPLRRIL